MTKKTYTDQVPHPGANDPLIIQYTQLLHQYRDTEAEPVKAFVQAHLNDLVFVKRVKTLNKVFKLKAELDSPGF
jgi:hypothetical protein